MHCLLDLGTQKTGSKCRQAFFARQGHRIPGRQLCYPASGRIGAWHRPLYDALASSDWGLLRAIADEAEGQGTDLVILSYEELHKLDSAAIASLARCFPQLDALVFLRRQDRFVNSLHNQLHKSHRVPLAELEHFESQLGDYDSHSDYGRMLQRWGNVLGRHHVHPILFKKDASPVSSFFAAVGIPLDLVGYVEPHPNRAIDDFGICVLREVKRLTGDTPDLLQVMREAHRRLAPHFAGNAPEEECYTLDLATRERIMSHYRDSNDWVCRHFFPDQASLFPAMETGKQRSSGDTTGHTLAAEILAAARASCNAPPATD